MIKPGNIIINTLATPNHIEVSVSDSSTAAFYPTAYVSTKPSDKGLVRTDKTCVLPLLQR